MKMILTEKVPTLGNVGEIINVSPGYGRNYLLPKNLAVLADEGNQRQLANHQKQIAKKIEAERALAEGIKKKLGKIKLEIFKKVGGSGRLFGTITNSEIANELKKKGIEVERRLIIIERPIKTLGEFEVDVKLFAGVDATVKINVNMDPKQAEEFKAAQAIAAKKKSAVKKRGAESKSSKSEDVEESLDSKENSESEEK